MTEFDAGPGREEAINELTQARALEAYIRQQDS